MSRLLVRKASFLFLAISLLIAPASYVNAGFLSFLGNIFGKSTSAEVEVPQDYTNSQSEVLLQAVVNANPKLASGGGDITIVNNSALLSDVGPSGTSGGGNEFSPSGDQLSIYVVREGDTISQIAEMFNVSVNTVMWSNDIPRGGTIHEGETLVILPVSGVKHTVAKGETVQSIAKKYGGDAEEIIGFNNLKDEDALAVGMNIVVPNGALAAPPVSSVARATTRGTSGPSYSGYYMYPLSNGIKSQGLHGYNGVDLAAPTGTTVFASASGDVVVSKFREGNPWFGGYGNYIVVSHDNGTQTLYAHLSGVVVGEGWRVVKGQVIGYVGSTGRSTGAHLHFEVRGAQNPFR